MVRRTDFTDCPRPVLLLYGFMSTRRTFEVLEHRLRRDHYCVWSINLGGLFDAFNPATMLGARVKRMVSGEFSSPSWELQMARKDARLMLEEGERHGVPLTMLPAIAATMDRFIERGHGRDDWMVIAKDALDR